MKKNRFLMRDVSGKPGASDAGGSEDLPAKLTRPRAAVAPLKETYQYRLVIVFHFGALPCIPREPKSNELPPDNGLYFVINVQNGKLCSN